MLFFSSISPPPLSSCVTALLPEVGGEEGERGRGETMGDGEGGV